MEVKGTVKLIAPAETGVSQAGKQWKKQVIVVDTGADYNPDIAIQAFGDDKIKDLNKLSVGDSVAAADVNNDGLADLFYSFPLKNDDHRNSLYINQIVLTY